MRSRSRRPIGAADLTAACLRSFRKELEGGRRLGQRGFGARRLCRLDAIVLSRRRRLLIGPACVLLIGFVAADDASCNNADFAVPCQMARDAADDSALDASLCLSGGWDKHYPQNGGAKDQRLHGNLRKNQSLQQAGLPSMVPEKA